jgi:hypothetical protein
MILFGDLSFDLNLGLNGGSFALSEPLALFGLSFLLGKVGELVFGLLQPLAEVIKFLLLLILLSQLCPELHPWHP